jgi:hypothetical protein
MSAYSGDLGHAQSTCSPPVQPPRAACVWAAPLPIGTRESELLRMLVMGFQVAYGHEDEIEVKKKGPPTEAAEQEIASEPILCHRQRARRYRDRSSVASGADHYERDDRTQAGVLYGRGAVG